MEYTTILLILAGVFGLFMAWGIGANDVANAMGTSVGSKAITIKQAIIIAAIFEFTGAFLAGGEVTATIRSGIIDAGLFTDTPEVLVHGMLAALLAAGVWLLIASSLGWPVSTTHSIVGAIVGFAVVAVGISAVQWSKIGTIAASWIISPIIAGSISFVIFRSVQILILDRKNPIKYAKRYVPIYIFAAAFVISLMTMFKGLKHVGLNLSIAESYGMALLIATVITAIGWFMISRIKIDLSQDDDFHYTNVEKIFGILMVVSACAMAFAHGSNDVANAIGPVAAIVSIVQEGGVVGSKAPLSMWLLLLGAFGIVLGLVTYGYRVMATIGKKITELTPSRGFSAELSAASTVVFASGIGLPISTTHTLVGAVLGVGFARGISALNMNVIRMIFMSWIITLPAGGILAVIFYFMLKWALGG